MPAIIKEVNMSVKWGVLGTANIAWGCTIPGMKMARNCELYAIAGRSADKVNKFKEEFGFKKAYVGYENLVADPEVQAIYIPLTNDLHKEWVIRSLKAGKNVICEKPLALNADEAREMFAAAKDNNVYLMEAYAYQHSPYVASLKEDIASGIIGDVDYIETEFVGQELLNDFRLHKEMGGGAVYDLGCYCTTMIMSVTDSEPETIRGVAEFNENGVDIYASVYTRFKNGVRASFNVGMIFPPGSYGRKDRLFVHGTRGSIDSAVEYNQAGELSYTITVDGQKTVRTVTAGQNYMLECEQMGRCIENGEKPHVTPEFSIKNAEYLDMILKAIGYTK